MAPILPGLSDDPALMADVVRAARDAGATSIWTNVLYLRPGTREHFLENLARDWAELVPRYESLYRGRAYLPTELVEPVRREVAELRNRFELPEHRPPPPIHRAPVAGASPKTGSAHGVAGSRQLELPLPL
jgi:DNA repair photolyase